MVDLTMHILQTTTQTIIFLLRLNHFNQHWTGENLFKSKQYLFLTFFFADSLNFSLNHYLQQMQLKEKLMQLTLNMKKMLLMIFGV